MASSLSSYGWEQRRQVVRADRLQRARVQHRGAGAWMLYMIIEAARIKTRKQAEKTPDKPAPRPAVVAAVAPSGPAAPSRAAPSAPAAAPALPAATASATEVPLAIVGAPPRAQPESAVVTVDAERAQMPAAATDPEPEAAPPPLRLLDVVEPATPRALLEQLRGDVRAQVRFTVAPDGAVREPRLASITHPSMASSVLQAVRQWRYEAIPEPRAHEVEIVLRQN